MAFFQAKTCSHKLRKIENKNYRFDQSLPDPEQRIPNKQKKIKKIKIQLLLLFKPEQVEKGREREKIKIIVPINSYLTHNREFQNNSKKIQKNSKTNYGFFSSQNRLGQVEKEKKKNYRSDQFLPDPEQRIPKKQQKQIKKLKYTFTASF